MRIPTLLGLFILALIGGVMVFGTLYIQKLTAPVMSSEINSLQVSNLSDTSATVTWFSTVPTLTNAYIGDNKNFTPLDFQAQHDDRDGQKPLKRATHIATINNLQPGHSYFVKVTDDAKKVGNMIAMIKTLTSSQPTHIFLSGTVVNASLQPITEALVFFGQGDNLRSTYVTDQGNYLLSVNQSPDSSPITITNGQISSQVKVASAPANPIPAVVFGQNLDLTNFALDTSTQTLGVATQAATIAPQPTTKPTNTPEPKTTLKPTATPKPAPVSNDINGDGVVNSLDIAILERNIGKNSSDPKWESLKFMDLNSDGKIDSKDMTILKAALH